MTAQLSREELQAIADTDHVQCGDAAAMARMLLAGMDSEPVAKVDKIGVFWYADNGVPRKPAVGAELYAAPPAQVAVPEDLLLAMEDVLRISDRDHEAWHRARAGISACRAAMLKHQSSISASADAGCSVGIKQPSSNDPITAATVPDDTRRMDWLISKTVNVCDPLVYGSRSMFWSQTISDDWEEGHKTALREQIDAAMSAEKPAAPEQEV